MTEYFARMLDAETGGEGRYRFEGPEDLMQRTADEIVTVFFDYVEHDVMRHHVDWELNSVFKNRERRVVVATGSLIPKENKPALPFMLMIADKEAP